MDSLMHTALEMMRPEPGGARNTASSRIYDDLRQRILSLELPPGTALLRAELAKTYDVSQTPLRDALQRLEGDGLIHIYPQSRTLVTRINMARIHDGMVLRKALECEVAAALAEKPDPVTIARLRGVIEMQKALAPDHTQLRRFQELDEYFHAVLFESVKMLRLHELQRSQITDMDRVRRLQAHSDDRLRTIIEGHSQVVDAIAAGDGARAVAAMRLHLHKPNDWADEYREKFPDYFS